MQPVAGEPLRVPSGLPKTLEEALHRYGSAMFKATAITVLNPSSASSSSSSSYSYGLNVSSKHCSTITYGKLLSRARKIAFTLLNKIKVNNNKNELRLKPGDRIALVYPNDDPISFACAFYGCLMAGIVPVPIEVPVNKDDAISQQIGFLLGTCNVSFALTSDSCKHLCKINSAQSSSTSHHSSATSTSASASDNAQANNSNNFYRGWPEITWIMSDNFAKPPKDWNPPPRVSEELPAYIEYKIDSHDGSMKGVTISRRAMMSHCKALSSACSYCEGETMVCVLDFKREAGLWHSIQTSILNGMHVIFVPYALMKLNPASWMLTVTKTKATVAICKSRDLHWGLLSSRDHKEINLSTLRFVLVADGANPWSLSSCDQFISVFLARGLRAEAICPCAISSEALTISIRRPISCANSATSLGANIHHSSSSVTSSIGSNAHLTSTTTANANNTTTTTSGRGILSMNALSYGVIRVDQEATASSLSLQDCGLILPQSVALVAQVNDTTKLCKTDEVGEILISSQSVGSCYWGLQGLTNSIFKECPQIEQVSATNNSNAIANNNAAIYDNQTYVRTGLLGFIGPGSLVFICGTRDGLMQVSGRRHNTDDLIATILSIEPMKFVYRGRIAALSIKILRDERICIFAEQRPECSEEESFQWMSRVLQAIDCVHQVSIYCLALVLPNQLPKTPLGGIHLSEVRRKFLDGTMNPANVLMCPHATVNNLPKERQLTHSDVGPASIIVGNIVQGVKLAVANGPPLDSSSLFIESNGDNNSQSSLTNSPLSTNAATRLNNELFITEYLKQRAIKNADHNLFTLVSAKLSTNFNDFGYSAAVQSSLNCSSLHKRAERIGAMLLEKRRVLKGDHIALLYPPGLDLIAAFYGCLYIGCVPVVIRPPGAHNLLSSLPTAKMIVDVSKSVLILTSSNISKLIKSRESLLVVDFRTWIPIVETDDVPKRKLSTIYKFTSVNETAYLDFSVSTTGMLSGVKITHGALLNLCKSIKLACELYPSRHLVLAADPYNGLGLALWCVSGIYSGHHTFLVPPIEVEHNPSIFLHTISANKVRDVFCSYSVMELCTKGLADCILTLKTKGVNLNCVRTCVALAEERPRVNLLQSFSKLFSTLGLATRAVTTSFGCRANIAICLQGFSSPQTTKVYIDSRALRHDRIALVKKGAPHSLPLMQCGNLLPGTKVIIANPETKGHCGDSNLGEIWIQSAHNSMPYFSTQPTQSSKSNLQNNIHENSQQATNCELSSATSRLTLDQQFNQKVVTADQSCANTTFARTGYLGFLRHRRCIDIDEDDDGTNNINNIDSNNSKSVCTGNIELDDEQLGDSLTTSALFVVGSLDETIMLRGLRYYPIDIEATIARCHKKVAECAVFTWTSHLVVVVELDGRDCEALDLVPLITSAVLEEHHLIVGVIAIVDVRVVPINSRGEKQRMHLRDKFLADQLDPIYVAYNM